MKKLFVAATIVCTLFASGLVNAQQVKTTKKPAKAEKPETTSGKHNIPHTLKARKDIQTKPAPQMRVMKTDVKPVAQK